MKFGSLFTGVGGFDLGFERAGMTCVWQVEKDRPCRSVLDEHWPDVQKYEDVKNVGITNLEPVDVICGGFPCQDVSIAGKRAGLAGERSGLWSEFARIIDELEPKWVVIENVPGLLSSHRGRDFATVIRWLAERGYGVAWRILDSQYFGVAQRRRRVFIVGSFGNGSASEILFESEGVRWNIEKGRKTGKGTAGTIEDSTALGFDLAQITSKANYSNPKKGDPQPPLNTFGQGYVAYENHPADSRITETGRKEGKATASTFTIRTGSDGGGKGYLGLDDGAMTLGGQPQWVNQVTTHRMTAFGEYSDDGKAGAVKARDYKGATDLIVLNDQGGSQMSVTENVSAKLRSQEHGHQPMVIAYENHPADSRITETGDISQQLTSRMETGGGNVPLVQMITAPTLTSSNDPSRSPQSTEITQQVDAVLRASLGVRRLTPTECERLQGFPDGFTTSQSDTQRYKQMGNAVTVNVAEWIGRRIMSTAPRGQKEG